MLKHQNNITKKLMANKKQTAVEWLENKMLDLGMYIHLGATIQLHARFQRAKELEKQKMIEFALYFDDRCRKPNEIELDAK